MIRFGVNLGPIHRWIIHNIQTGPMCNEGIAWGCQIDLADDPAHTGLEAYYDGSGGQAYIGELNSQRDLQQQFFNDCEECLRRLFPTKHITSLKRDIAEGLLAIAVSDDESLLSFESLQELLSYLVVNGNAVGNAVVGYDPGSKDGDSSTMVAVGSSAELDPWHGDSPVKLGPNAGPMPTPMEYLRTAEELADEGSFPEAYATFLVARKRFRAQKDYDPLSSAAERISDGIQRCRDSGQV